jgi:hypothetical protein
MTLATVAFKVCSIVRRSLSGYYAVLLYRSRTHPVMPCWVAYVTILSMYCVTHSEFFHYIPSRLRISSSQMYIMDEAHVTLQTEFAVDMTCQSVSASRAVPEGQKLMYSA